ncbi:capsid assembly scaffolding protein Gp46 family protein [Planomicrobium okeanokoites]|uniref:capsid assembly scaffolding protein Gp46 family protein n=1 Tax=Planomicrobium okeanokoites TaxID=244 RepID=UPI0009FDFEB5|nr:DUF4355 domain-containing protein [Planomicrobium okeanokoites]
MKINMDKLKELVEAGDNSALEKHVYESLERGDLSAAAAANKDVLSDLDSAKDTHHKTALDTWKTKNLTALVDEEVKKRNPPEETPEQKRIRELEEKIENGEKATQRAELKNKAMAYATEHKLPSQFASKYIERFLGDDESATTATLAELKTDLDGLILEAVNQKFKDGGRDPKSGEPIDTSVGASFAKNANEQGKSVETTLWD